jgi:phenylacetic acid degradation operon negative regulatory protein
VAERSARQALARLKDQGLVEPERHGRRTRWNLSAAGRHLLTVGSERIYQFGAARGAWDRQWLVVFSPVPEEQRAKRHQLRGQLEFSGFGFLGAGVAVSPHADREDAANAVLRELGLVDTAVVFRAEVGSLLEPDALLRRAWDLEAIAAGYDEFVAAFETLAPRRSGATFAALVELVHEWRRFPFGDPEIPDELLPATWPGRRARRLFEQRRTEWAPAAGEWFDGREAAAQRRT